MDDRIGPTRRGIAFHLRFPARRRKINQRILRNFALVHFQISDRRRIRRPPVRRLDIQLFGIHPVQLTLANLFRSALCHSAFFAVCEIHKPDVVIANKTYISAIGRNLGIRNRCFAGNDRVPRLRLHIQPRKRRGALKQNPRAIGCPLILRGSAPTKARGLRGSRSLCRQNRFEFVACHQKPAFP